MLGAAFKFVDLVFDRNCDDESSKTQPNTRRSFEICAGTQIDGHEQPLGKVTIEGQSYDKIELEENQRRILEEFKKYAERRPKSMGENQSAQKQKNPEFKRHSNKPASKAQLKSILSKIDQLSEEYLETIDHDFFVQTLAASQAVSETIQLEPQANLQQSMKVSTEKNSAIKAEIGMAQTDQPSQKIDLENQVVQSRRQKDRDSMKKESSSVIRQILLSLGMVKRVESQMHIDVVMQIAHENLQQMKKSGLWQGVEQFVQMGGNDPFNNTGNIFKRKNSILSKNKRVKVVTPQTMSELEKRKESLDEKLSQALYEVSSSISVVKYCYNKHKVENAIICFSSDFAFMVCKSEGKAGRMVSLKNLSGVLAGKKTKNFKRYIGNHEGDQNLPQPSSEDCFSLIFNDRTFDFSVRNGEKADRIVDSLKLLMNCS